MNYIVNFLKNVSSSIGIEYIFLLKIIETFFVFIVLFVLKSFFLKILFKNVSDLRVYYSWRKIIGYVYISIIILGLVNLWLNGFKYIATFLGLLSAGLAIALKDFVFDFVAWFFILVRRPFEIGDRIEVNGIKGDVIDIRFLQFTLLEIGEWVDAEQSTGRIVHIGNSLCISKSLYNYSKGFQYIWNEIAVLVTFESNWIKAKSLIDEIGKTYSENLSEDAQRKVKEASRKYLIFYDNLTPVVYTKVDDSGIRLTLRYLCEPKKRRISEHEFWEDLLLCFGKEDDIDFAYPTTRYYDNKVEGKVTLN